MKRIMIIGCGDAGKTMLARRIAEHLKLPLYNLDNYFWESSGREADSNDFVLKQYELISQNQWIDDGKFHRTLATRMPEADNIIF